MLAIRQFCHVTCFDAKKEHQVKIQPYTKISRSKELRTVKGTGNKKQGIMPIYDRLAFIVRSYIQDHNSNALRH